MDTILVTGGAGFIGSNFVRFVLAQTDARVVVFDKLTYAGSLLNVPDDSRVTFVKGDVADRGSVWSLYEEQRPTWVVNFAAESHVDRSIDGPRDFLHTNVIGTFELLEGARHHLATCQPEVRDTFRLLHVSTDEVFGSLEGGGLFSETTPYAPNSPYSASKASADHFVRAYASTYGLPVLVTNCSNNYGPYQFPEKLIPLALLNAIEGKALPIYGDGLNVRDWLYVEDHCSGIFAVLQRGRVGEKYNIGSFNERTNLEIVDHLCEALEEQWPACENPVLKEAGVTSYRELKTFVPDRPGHDRRYAVDASKVQNELGWHPKYNLEAGLRATVQWYLANRDWCASVQDGRYGRERLGLAASGAKPR
ncbi:MAG TPA: dTDP-glucose 4,6-dehydratase [Candidatus Acidoferrales bacterium]|nr:dTDP-glucose 4,6-dehydratase [Candidatus Acidoferrales bacterium]